MTMFGEGGAWPPFGAEYCPVCDRPVHPGECSGGTLAPTGRSITEPIPTPVPVPVEPARPDSAPVRGSKRNAG